MALSVAYSKPDLAFLPDETPIRFIMPFLGERFYCIVGADSSLKIAFTHGTIHARLATAAEAPPMPISNKYVWLRVVGQKEGEADLTLTQGADTLQIKVNVLHWRWLHVNFYITTDANGTPSFNSSQTAAQVKILDRIYRSQACVDFARQLTKSITVTSDCSKVAMTNAEESAMWAEFLKKTPADVRGKTFFQVFCVKAWGGHDTTAGYNAWATSNGIQIIIDDFGYSKSSPVLAHEMGHSLGLDHTNNDGFLMRQGDKKGPKLTWAQVQTVRTYVD